MNRRLLDHCCAITDGALTAEALADLETLLRADPAARRDYIAFMRLQSLLERGEVESSRFKVQCPTSPTPTTPTLSTPTPVGGRSVWYSTLPFAAAALITLALTAWFLLSPSPQPQTSNPSATTASSPVAMLTDLSADATFAASAAPMRPGADLPPGPIRLTAGSAQVMFASSAVADLKGPCEFEMIGPNRGRLTSGTLEVYVPGRARGFTLDLPDRSRIVDLGTAFRVAVDDAGQAVVRVTEGRVAWHAAERDADPVPVVARQAIRIVDGRASFIHEAELAITARPADAEPYNLTEYGPLDWAYWTADSTSPQPGAAVPTNQKDGAAMIGPMTPVGGDALQGIGITYAQHRFGYADGQSPPRSQSQTHAGLFNAQLDRPGVGVQVPVTFPDTASYRVTVWASAYRAKAVFTVDADGNSVVDATLRGGRTRQGQLYTVTVSPAYPAQTIRIRLTLKEGGDPNSNVSLAAVAVAAATEHDNTPNRGHTAPRGD